MADFLDRYGFKIVVAITTVIGVFLISWLLFWSAHQGYWPPRTTEFLINAQTRLSDIWVGLDRLVRAYGHWAGAIGSVLTFTVGLVGTIGLLRRQLPRRLLRFLAEDRIRLIAARSEIRGLIEQVGHNLRNNERTLFAGPMNRAFGDFNLGGADSGFRSLGRSLNELKVTAGVAAANQRLLREQVASAHLLRAAVLISRHEQQPKFGLHLLHAAVSELNAAKTAVPDDLDVLDLLGDLLRRLKQTDLALEIDRQFVDALEQQVAEDEHVLSRGGKGAEAYARLGAERVSYASLQGVHSALNEGRRLYVAGADLLSRKDRRTKLSETEALQGANLYLAAMRLAAELGQPQNYNNHKAAGLAIIERFESQEVHAATAEFNKA